MCSILPFKLFNESLLFQQSLNYLFEFVIRPAALLQSHQEVHCPPLKVDLAAAERSAGVDGESDASGWRSHGLKQKAPQKPVGRLVFAGLGPSWYEPKQLGHAIK